MTKLSTMQTRTFALGGELQVNRIGFGAMRLTGQPGNFGPFADWEGGKTLLRHAVDLGVTFLDTARAYGPQWNEKLIAEALHPYAPGIVVATKGGIDKFSPTQLVRDASRTALRQQVDDALKNLKLDRIDVFQLHWVDPNTPIEDSVAVLNDMRNEGKIRFIGLCNVDQEQLDRALAVAPIASIQNRYNIAEREHDKLIDYTSSRNIAFIPYGPLGAHPMKQGAPLAAERGTNTQFKPAQEALAELLRRSPNIVVIPGTTSISHLEENWGTWAAV
jgi:pyridoxine 4-dehydrogenase